MEGYATLLTNWPAIENFTSTVHTESYPFISPQNVTLEQRSVLITGASRGIGRATVKSFAKAGCSKIAVISRSDLSELQRDIEAAAKHANRAPPQFLAIQIDISSEQSVADAAAEVKKQFGSLDILINNAGTSDALVPFLDSDPKQWWWTWEANVKGLYLVTRALLPLLLDSTSKTVINVSSCGAHMLMAMSYQTSKMAVTRLTEFLATEFGPQGLIAMSIHPGNCLTDLSLRVAPKELHDTAFPDSPELAGDTMVWLSSQRREWLSGRFVSVTWDMEDLERKKNDIVQRDVLKFRLTL